MPKVSAIVPAAGLSRRFGGPNKLLQPWGEGTVVGSVVKTLLDLGLFVVVVTGRDPELVAEVAGPAKCTFNHHFRDGLGTSIACGVVAAPASEGYLVALGDMPGIRKEVVVRLIEAFKDAGPDAIVVPIYDEDPDRFGHPVLFGSKYKAALELLEGDEGARSIIHSAEDKVVRVPVTGKLRDIDAPE